MYFPGFLPRISTAQALKKFLEQLNSTSRRLPAHRASTKTKKESINKTNAPADIGRIKGHGTVILSKTSLDLNVNREL